VFDAGEIAFAWAKASGIVGKTFLGPRGATLLSVSRLSELDRLLFPDSPADLPERELSVVLERRIAERAVSRTLRIVSAFRRLRGMRALVFSFRVRGVFASAGRPPCRANGTRPCARPGTLPDPPERGYRTWPHEPKAPSSLGPPKHRRGNHPVGRGNELDRRYYAALWNDVAALPSGESQAFQRLLAEESP
jgi:hypothetical protein